MSIHSIFIFNSVDEEKSDTFVEFDTIIVNYPEIRIIAEPVFQSFGANAKSIKIFEDLFTRFDDICRCQNVSSNNPHVALDVDRILTNDNLVS